MSFRISGLPAASFQLLFAMSDAQLARHGALRRVADSGGYPCRISLTDAAVGDVVILVNYLHQPADTPYRACHAIYVREDEQTFDAIDEVPAQLRRRMLSVRGFDTAGMMTKADLVDGADLAAMIGTFFADPGTRYLHLHFAKPGCYAAWVERG